MPEAEPIDSEIDPTAVPAPEPESAPEPAEVTPELSEDDKIEAKARELAQKRIDEVVRQRWQERQAREKAEQELQQLRQGEAPREEDVQKIAERIAEQKIAQQDFQRRVNETTQRGLSDEATKAEYSDAVSALHNTFNLDNFGAPGQFVDLVTSDPNGHKIIAHLGKNLAEAERILSLPAVQQARELGRLSVKLEKPAPKAPKASSAPTPAEPLRSGGGAGEPAGPRADGSFSDQETFRRWRESQRRK